MENRQHSGNDGRRSPCIFCQRPLCQRRCLTSGRMQRLSLCPHLPGRLQAGLDAAEKELLLCFLQNVLCLCPSPAAGNGPGRNEITITKSCRRRAISSAAVLFISPGWKFPHGSPASSYRSNFCRHNPYFRSSASGAFPIHSPFRSFGQWNR